MFKVNKQSEQNRRRLSSALISVFEFYFPFFMQKHQRRQIGWTERISFFKNIHDSPSLGECISNRNDPCVPYGILKWKNEFQLEHISIIA